MGRRPSGYGWVLLAAVMWSTSGFFAKAPVFAGWPGAVLAFWRALFASMLLVLCVRRPSWSWGLVPMVLIFALMSATYLMTMERAEASVAIWLQNTAPAWVFLVGVWWLREPVQRHDWAMLALCGLGVGVIVQYQIRQAAVDAVLLGLASGALYGGVILSLRRLREHEPAFLVALNHVGTSVLLFPVAWGSGYWPHGVQWLYLAAFGMLQLGLPYMFLARGLRTVPSHQASLLTLVEPLLVPVWVYLAWGRHPSYQPPSVWTVAGGLLIISGLLYRHVFRDGLRSGNNVNSRAPQKTSTA